jgi:hypothetical protein
MLRLKEQLQALAMPFAIQHNLYEDFVAVEDELALDFDHWQQVIIGNFRDKLTTEQTDLLQHINRKFDEMSDRLPKEVWSCESLRSSPDWEEIRSLARRTLHAFRWRASVPIWTCGVSTSRPKPRPDADQDGIREEPILAILRTGTVRGP